MTLENFKQLRNKQMRNSRKKKKNRIDGYLHALKTNTLDEYYKKRGRRHGSNR